MTQEQHTGEGKEAMAVGALNRILMLRSPGDVETCKKPRELVRQMECIASQALVAASLATLPEIEDELRAIINRTVCSFVGEYAEAREELIRSILSLVSAPQGCANTPAPTKGHEA